MKIPKKLRIEGMDYTVNVMPIVLMDNHVCHGRVDFGHLEIQLNEGQGEHQHNCRTLWHEIFHVITENAGLKFEDEEQVMNIFAAGVYQVLQDNGKKLFDLK